jgi:hypothetical protein
MLKGENIENDFFFQMTLQIRIWRVNLKKGLLEMLLSQNCGIAAG